MSKSPSLRHMHITLLTIIILNTHSLSKTFILLGGHVCYPLFIQ